MIENRQWEWVRDWEDTDEEEEWYQSEREKAFMSRESTPVLNDHT